MLGTQVVRLPGSYQICQVLPTLRGVSLTSYRRILIAGLKEYPNLRCQSHQRSKPILRTNLTGRVLSKGVASAFITGTTWLSTLASKKEVQPNLRFRIHALRCKAA